MSRAWLRVVARQYRPSLQQQRHSVRCNSCANRESLHRRHHRQLFQRCYLRQRSKCRSHSGASNAPKCRPQKTAPPSLTCRPRPHRWKALRPVRRPDRGQCCRLQPRRPLKYSKHHWKCRMLRQPPRSCSGHRCRPGHYRQKSPLSRLCGKPHRLHHQEPCSQLLWLAGAWPGSSRVRFGRIALARHHLHHRRQYSLPYPRRKLRHHLKPRQTRCP